MKNSASEPVLNFTKKERRGIIIILLINGLLLAAPGWYRHFVKQQEMISIEKDSSAWDKENAREPSEKENQETEFSNHEKVHRILFNFNPNSLDKDGWKRLGLSDKTISTIIHYREKGGIFHQPEDLYKIWGMPQKKAAELMPYIIIPEQKKQMHTKEMVDEQTVDFLNHKPLKQKVNINMADSAAFEQLPGIGPVLSKRIVAYRKKLGGFVSIEQLKEVWGLQDSIFQKIKAELISEPEKNQKRDINKCDFDELKSHPYIGYQLAKLIINYRKQHGNFSSLEEIQTIIPLTEIQFNHIAQYFLVNK